MTRKRRYPTPSERAKSYAKRVLPGPAQDLLLRQHRSNFEWGYLCGWNARSKIAGKQLPGENYHEYVARVSRRDSER